MHSRSFQTRLALLAALVSGAILVAFGIAAWLLIRQQFLQSIDARILVPAQRYASVLRPDMDWERAEQRLARRFPDPVLSDEIETVLFFSDPEGTLLFAREDSAWLTEHDLTPWLPVDSDYRYPPPTNEDFDRFVFRAGNPLDPLPPPPRPRPDGPPPDDGRRPGGGPPPEDGPRPGGPRGNRPPAPAPPPVEPKFFTLVAGDGEQWRMVSLGNPHATIFAGARLASFSNELRRPRAFFLIALPLSFIAVGMGGWLVARRALRPLHRISAIASQITASDLDERIPVTGREYREFSQLVDTLNLMMERLEASFHQATRFTADASHELKTPIALMQAEVDAALKNTPPDTDHGRFLLDVAEEIQRLKSITQSLLFLSHVDAGKVTLTKSPVDLSQEIEALCEDAELLCGQAGLTLKHEIEPGLSVEADPTLLTQAAHNLLNNAIKYNLDEGGTVSCTLARDGDQARLDFRNTGPGIPDDDRERIFERFYRLDPARARKKDGFGLGLNLALEIIRAHGGQLDLVDGSPENTTFRITLPLAPQS